MKICREIQLPYCSGIGIQDFVFGGISVIEDFFAGVAVKEEYLVCWITFASLDYKEGRVLKYL